MRFTYMENCNLRDHLLHSYFAFTREVFHFDLGNWWDAGYWDNRYIPHSLLEDGKVVANVSASLMTLQIRGEDVPAVQIGSVGVLPAYRGQGLARMLMERVMDTYGEYPLIFLFAGAAVSGFYLKCGFDHIGEIAPRLCATGGGGARPRSIALDSRRLERLAASRLQRSSILDARGNSSIYWYHLMYDFAAHIYHIPERDIVFLAEYNGDTVHVYDILTENPVSFDDIMGYILAPETREERFHFTPDWLTADYKSEADASGEMYAAGSAVDMLKGLSFKFPITAQT